MSSLTRILNNQIFSKTIIASQKIADGTITGSLFSSNVTVPGDLLISGNLFVLGTSAYTTIASTNTYVNDPLVVLNNGFAGTNTYDEGVVFNRGSLLNQAFIWSEFNKEFRLIGTTETGTAYGNVAVSNFANLHVGNLTVDYTINTTGNFFTSGFINTSGNISGSVGLFGSINSTGLINTTGNLSASQASVGTLNATGLINTLGNISASEGSFATVKATGLINTTGNVSAVTVNAATVNASGNVLAAVFNGGAVNVSGNVSAATVLAQLVTADDATFGNVAAGFVGNTGTEFTGASINLSGNVIAAGGIYNALTVNGNETVTGYLNVAGNVLGSAGTLSTLDLNSTTNATDATGTTGALQIAGGASIAKDLWVGGNIYASNIFGVTHQIITVQDPLVYFDAANTFPYNYDIGFYSNFVGPNPIDNTGNAYQHSGVVRDNSDNTWKFFSNVRSEPAGTAITFDSDTIFDPIRAGNLTLTYTQDSTSATTGSFKTAGGAGIGGNIFQTGTQLQTSASNYIFATTPTTVDAFKAATTLNVGANSGTLTIGNPTVVGTQATQALYNTIASTINFGRAANITMGHTDGTTTLQGNANVRAVTNGITFTQGALISAGAVGVAGNLNIKGNSRVTIGAELAGGVVYPENQIQAVFNAPSEQRIGITNFNTSGTAEFSAFADNGSNIARFVSTGITNSSFGGNLAIGPGDAYTYVNLGNLYLGSSDYDVGILAGGLYANSLVARFSTINSNIQFLSSRVATSATQAAFTVAGGAGIAGNLYVAKGAVFNSGLSTDTFQIKSSTSGNVALFANLSAGAGTSESVIIGGANTVVQSGVTLKVNSTTTMMVPVGPTSARPSSIFGAGYDVAGMMRFNNTINNLEFYDGTTWQAAGSTFTVISDRQFSGNVAGGFGNVDGTNTNFTIQANSTTAGSIVSINGVMQFPTLAYSVTGSTLTFTEPPAPGDVIDVRIITTTTTVSTLASGNGLNQFIAADTGAQIWTGSASTTERIEVDTAGNFNFLTGNKVTYDQTVVSVPDTNLTLLDSFSANSYTTSKYVISMKQGTGNVQAMEALLTQSTVGTTPGTAYVTTYGIVNTGNTMGTLAANVDISGSWTVKLWLIPNAGTAISNVKVMTTYIV